MMRRSTFVQHAFVFGAVTWASSARAFSSVSGTTPAPIIRVRLFAGLPIVRIDVTSPAPIEIVAGSAAASFSASTSVSAGDPATTLVARDVLAIAARLADGQTITRRYSGNVDCQSIDGRLRVINTVGLEPYVASVMSAEISAGWQREALAAQAIAIRTYARKRMAKSNAVPYDLNDDTSNQVYRGTDGVAPSHAAAARATAGRIVVDRSAPADIWYHSACGGHTAAEDEIVGRQGPAYLDGVADTDASGRAYCAASPYFKWRNSIASAAVASVAGVDRDSLADLAVSDRWPDGRAKTVRATRADGSTVDVEGHAFYARSGVRLGYKVLPSTLFEVTRVRDAYIFTGKGVGHGVGMCQWGAQGRARAGANAEDILAAYFPGTRVTDRAAGA